MSDDHIYYNKNDRDPWETADQARSRQREVQEKQILGQKQYEAKINSYKTNYHTTAPSYNTGSSFEVKRSSNFWTSIGVLFLISSFVIWQDYLGFGEQILWGYQLESVLLWAGIGALLARYVLILVAVAMYLFGGFVGLSAILALLSGVELAALAGNIGLTVVLFIIGTIILRRKLNS